MRWGLVPFFWKKTPKDVPATFNARAETVADKPMFREAFASGDAGIKRVGNPTATVRIKADLNFSALNQSLISA
jgi:SOS response associated peptidase (SRAP)